MSDDLNSLFKQFDPPSGGAERFRMRLDPTQGDRAPRWRLAVAVTAAVALVVGALVVPWDADRKGAPAENRVAAAPEFDRLLGRTIEVAEPAVTVDDEMVTLAAVETQNAKIRIYRIE
jgi:anti-sigma-K factor RskA